MLYRYIVLIAIIILILTTYLASSINVLAESKYHILVVASDMEDVIWAHTLNGVFREMGLDVAMDILYIGRDYIEASTDRSKLSDIGFLWNYNAVLLPDLNMEFSYGGRLGSKEIDTLKTYVERGHVVLIGLNTFVHSWHPTLEHMAGANIVGLIGGEKNVDILDIVFNNTVHRYNATFQAVLVSPNGCNAIAIYKGVQYPAICVNRFGYGITILATFNVVEAVVSQSNGLDIAMIIANVIRDSLASTKPQPPPYSYILRKSIENILLYPFNSIANIFGGGPLGYTVAIIFILLSIYIALLILSLLCIAPHRLRIAVVKPLTKILKPRKRELEILSIVRDMGPTTFGELLARTNMDRLKICNTLTFLEARKLVLAIVYRDEKMYVCREDLAKAIVALEPLYREITDMVQREPGITIHEIAARLAIAPDKVLNICRYLASIGVIELRKVSLEYEVYPIDRYSSISTHG